MCDKVCIEVNEIVDNITIEFNNTVENISVEVRDFSVYNILSPNLGNTATTDENGLLFVPESGGGGVTNHSQLILNDGTNPHGTTKSDVGLSNVDNTSDVDKPISTATQQALDLKANLTDIPKVPSFADQTEVNNGLVTDKVIAPDTLASWWTYVKGLAQTFAEKITFTSGALFSPQVAPTYEKGRIYFDDANDCISFMDSISGTSVQVGYEVLMRARNNTGATILNGSVVYISGAIGQNSTVALAQANTLPTSEIIGIATHDIPNNTVGKICVFGLVNDLNTSSFTDGQMLYLSATVAGGLTSTIPASPNFVVALGVVEHAHPTQGKILVKPQRALANNNALGTAQNVPPTQNAVKNALDSKVDKVTTAGVERVYTINADGSQGTKSTSELGGKRTMYLFFPINQNVAASNSWYALTSTGQILTGTGYTANASLTDANDFADQPVQTPRVHVPFQHKVKSVSIHGRTNSGGTPTVSFAVQKAFENELTNTNLTVDNPLIVAQQSFLLTKNPTGVNGFQYVFSSGNLDTSTQPAFSDYRLYFNNGNAASNLLNCMLIVEVEEVL